MSSVRGVPAHVPSQVPRRSGALATSKGAGSAVAQPESNMASARSAPRVGRGLTSAWPYAPGGEEPCVLGRVDIEISGPWPRAQYGGPHRVGHRTRVVAGLALRTVHAGPFPEAADEVRLAAQRQPQRHGRRRTERGHAQVLAIEHRLRPDQLLVELTERELRRQHGVLDVEEAVVEAGQAA